MSPEDAPRKGYVALLAGILVLIAAAVILPRWWENRQYRQAEKIGGVGAALLPGSLTDARRKVQSGMGSDKLEAALGRPSIAVHTDGASTHDIWTYYYAEGTLKINLSDGVVVRAGVDYNPPKIPTSARR